MADPYWPEIQTILSVGAGCMNGMPLSNDEGVFPIQLDDYDSVVRFGALIATVLNGWERDGNGDWVDPPVPTKAHAMPQGGPLPVDQVDRVVLWVENGMPKDPPAVG
jgi:hypothetical protein